MLLLVLILVLVAFGLLVIALLTSSVLWAWVSVGMSVAAASALLVDWLHRRSAVRDETEDGGAVSADRAARPVELGDIEPVTELIPVVRPFDSTSHGSIGNGVTAGYPGGTRSAVSLDSRFHPARDAEQTVVMPIVQPSGSVERPSGAPGGTDPVDGDSSPSVTFPASVDVVYEPGLTGERVVHDRTTGTTEVTDPAERADEGETATGAGSTSGSEINTDFDAGTGSEINTGAGTTAGPASMFGSEAGSVSPHHGVAAAPVSTSEPDGRSDGGDESTTIIRNSRDAVAEQPDTFPAPPQRVEDDPGADSEATVIVRSVTPAALPLPPVGPDGEPPEELPDVGIAGIVARLEDEVVVVDERPRYHLPTCPSVAANPLIPLPVREAVEYGFTPCGWCAPARALGDRHRTTAG
ncbi:MAG: hypothetical protein ACRDRH_23850 [Pseudonocardia sp.]